MRMLCKYGVAKVILSRTPSTRVSFPTSIMPHLTNQQLDEDLTQKTSTDRFCQFYVTGKGLHAPLSAFS